MNQKSIHRVQACEVKVEILNIKFKECFDGHILLNLDADSPMCHGKG